MDQLNITSIADILAASGSYGVVAILAWAFWKINEKKEKELKAICERVALLAESQTAVITKVDATLVALKEAIQGMRRG